MTFRYIVRTFEPFMPGVRSFPYTETVFLSRSDASDYIDACKARGETRSQGIFAEPVDD